MPTFDEAVAEMRKHAGGGRVTVLTYQGVLQMLELGLAVYDLADSLTVQRVIADHGTPAQKQRLAEELRARRMAEDFWGKV